MHKMEIMIVFASVLLMIEARDPATMQLEHFKNSTMGPIGTLTGTSGYSVEYQDANTALNSNLLRHRYFMESMTHLVRERPRDRFVHAKGVGAFGYFEVTNDISHVCKAKFLSKVGKRTKIFTRFSPVVPEKGSSDSFSDARGFAIKLYTEEGNFDIVGFNTPMFIVKDPLLFVTMTHALKRNPQTNLYDENMIWDFFTKRPEALHMFLQVFAGRGIPDGYRHMPGFSIHTYDVVNAQGEHHYVRFHFTPKDGIKNLTSEQAKGLDPDFLTRAMYNDIENGNFPSWTAGLQILSAADVKNATFDVFDTSRTLPLDVYPLHVFGRLVLNRNPSNYFADVEQVAYSPAHLVPGILGGVDKIFEARSLAYTDAQYYRLGSNFNKIKVNCPMTKAMTYLRDGTPPVGDNGGWGPNYYPNSFHGPEALQGKKDEILQIVEGDANNFDQARKLYEDELSDNEKAELIKNIVGTLSQAAPFLRERALKWFMVIHPDLGNKIAESL